MKSKLWLLQLPLIALFTFCLWVDEAGVQGDLDNPLLRDSVYPVMRRISGQFTDFKFRIRGPEKPRNKVVVVEIDSPSIEVHGRWPWHRDKTAALIEKVFESGAKVVGLDMVFSEADVRVPLELREQIRKLGVADIADQFETDRHLAATIATHADRLVLGWASDQYCQPAYQGEECPIFHPDAVEAFPPGFEKFSVSKFEAAPGFSPEKTPLFSALFLLANMPEYNALAAHSGTFNTYPDPDSIIRRISLLMMSHGKAYPSLALEMARVGLDEEIAVTMNDRSGVSGLRFAKSGRSIPVTPLSVMEINFRGKARTFPYVSAQDVMTDDPVLAGDPATGLFKGMSKEEMLKDAYVLIGLSALGVFDMRAFPFDNIMAGVEGHATILDNLLSGDSMVNTAMSRGSIWLFLLMTVGATAFAFAIAQLEAIPAALLFAAVFGGLGFVDNRLLFASNRNWNTSFFYLEIFFIFVLTLLLKYVVEERNKKFIRGAFTKYVAPAVVDAILKDPTKLSVGGEKKELTILFSDIRGFTSFSERMDAKQLAALLNDYLGIMTKLVFDSEGTLDKYIGDAIMAFWGAPLDQPKHAANSVKAAMAMMKALQEHKDRFRQQYGVRIDIGIGINTGMVNVGNMGSDTNFAYTVIGDHVNLASRLEGLTKEYRANIVTSRYTFDEILKSGEPLPPHRKLDDVKVKGKKQAVELIQVFWEAPPAEGLKLFDEARELYRQQRWDEAAVRFQQASDALAPTPDAPDGPSQLYIERCRDFKAAPPAPDWDGAWEMHSK